MKDVISQLRFVKKCHEYFFQVTGGNQRFAEIVLLINEGRIYRSGTLTTVQLPDEAGPVIIISGTKNLSSTFLSGISKYFLSPYFGKL